MPIFNLLKSPAQRLTLVRMSSFKSVCVVGLGYIGLPTSAVFANRGLQVKGADIRADIVDTLNQGKIHIEEPGLDVAVHAAVSSGKFRAYLEPQPADAFIIAVPTPFKENHQPDLSCVDAAVASISKVVRKGELVILESTSPPGTTERVGEILRSKTGLTPGTDIFLAHCPERVLPGRTMEELLSNDRIIGGHTPEAAKRAGALYSIFAQGNILLTDARTAEFTKLIENTYRDVNIALANELSIIAQKLGIDIWEAIKLANHHPRVKILAPGPGVGGHCIPVDPWFIVAAAPAEAKLIRAAREVNDHKPQFVEQQILAALGSDNSKKILLLGLSYKANVDDFRESPALHIAQRLTAKLGRERVLIHDPYLLPEAANARELAITQDLAGALSEASVVALLTDHKIYRELDPKVLREKQIVDTRGVWRFE